MDGLMEMVRDLWEQYLEKSEAALRRGNEETKATVGTPRYDARGSLVKHTWSVKAPVEFAYEIVRDGYLKPWEVEHE